MLEWIPYVLLAVILAFPLLQVGFWLGTRRLKGRAAPAFADLVELPSGGGDGRVMFYFYSSQCGPCRTMTPRLERLRATFPNVVMVDIADQAELTCRFGVAAIPAVLVVERGRIIQALLGKQSEARLRALLAG